MSSFSQLPAAVDPGVAQNPITEEEIRVAGEDWSDEVALGIVLNDAQDCQSFYQSKGLVPLGIENADDLVRAYAKPRQWADGKARANLSMHVTLQAIETLLPPLWLSLFGQGKKQPFLVEPTGQTKPEAARANASLLGWGIKQANLKEEMRIALKTALTYGFMVGEWGWESKTQRKKVYTVNKNDKGKPHSELKTEDIEIPMFECSDLKQILVDPGLKRQDVQNGAKFVIKQKYTDGYGLADLRNDPTYKNIPTDEELMHLLANKGEITTDELAGDKRAVWREFQAKLEIEWGGKDPMAQPLELLQYTTKDRVVTVLQRKLIVRNEPNEFGKINFQSCAFIDVLGSAWGWGVARLLAGEQRLQAGTMNNYIDGMALLLNPVFQLLKGIGPGTQSIPMSPGKVITESGELKPLIVPDVTKPAMEVIAGSDARAKEKVGANGGSNMSTGQARTAAGVSAFASDVTQRLQYWLEQFINLVYIPVLEAFLMVMKDHLTVEQVQSILTEEEGKAYVGDISDVYNATVDVDVLAGANMLARFATSQLAPLIMQLVSAGPVQDSLEVAGKKFDYSEFLDEVLDMGGWDLSSLITDMTPEDKARVQQKNAAMIKTAGDIQLQNQKHNDNLSEIDAKAAGQAGVATVRQILKTHTDQAIQQVEAMQNPESQQNQ